MKLIRQCTRVTCKEPAVATLTYVYEDSTAVLGPLARTAEPNAYDLCARHAASLTVPQGWQVIRLTDQFYPAEPSEEDLEALAEVVRQARKERPTVNTRTAGEGYWNGQLDSESVIGSRSPEADQYSMLDKQGLAGPPQSPDPTPDWAENGPVHLRVLPGGLPD